MSIRDTADTVSPRPKSTSPRARPAVADNQTGAAATSAIEPIIGHTKSDGLLERNRLAGAKGDAINAILVGAGHNIRLLLAWLRVLLRLLLLDLAADIEADVSRQSSPPALD